MMHGCQYVSANCPDNVPVFYGFAGKSLFPNRLTDADIATNIVLHALKQGIGKFRKTKNG